MEAAIITDRVSVAIVTYNTREHLRACLATVSEEDPREIVVVDNGSSDGTVETVRREYPHVLLYTQSNIGYGAAANQAITHCTAPYVLLLNADTRLERGALAELATYLDMRPEVGVVGPRLVYEDGHLQASTFPFPSPLDTCLEVSSIDRVLCHIPRARELYLRTWTHSQVRVVPWVMGAALAIRRDAFNLVGGFDESFFMYCEEVDLCYRMRLLQWKTHFAPVTTVVHTREVSTKQHRLAMRRQWFDSTVQFYAKHYPQRRLLYFVWIMKIVVALRLARDLIRRPLTRDPAVRSRMAEDMQLWRWVLRPSWPPLCRSREPGGARPT